MSKVFVVTRCSWTSLLVVADRVEEDVEQPHQVGGPRHVLRVELDTSNQKRRRLDHLVEQQTRVIGRTQSSSTGRRTVFLNIHKKDFQGISQDFHTLVLRLNYIPPVCSREEKEDVNIAGNNLWSGLALTVPVPEEPSGLV